MKHLQPQDLYEGLAVTCLVPVGKGKPDRRVHANVVSWKVMKRNCLVTVLAGNREEVFDLEDVLISDMGTTQQRFDSLADAYALAIKGVLPAVAVSGNPSLGKSYVLKEVLDAMGKDFEAVENGDDPSVRIIKGKVAPTSMYKVLYEHSRGGCVIFDDCDDALRNKDAAKLLKACLDTTGSRVVSWESKFIERMGIPTSFKFEGNIVFITNTPPEMLDDAVKSRCSFIDVFLKGAEYRKRFLELAPVIAKTMNIGKDIADTVAGIFLENSSSFVDDAPLMRLFQMNVKAVAGLLEMGRDRAAIDRYLSNNCVPYVRQGI